MIALFTHQALTNTGALLPLEMMCNLFLWCLGRLIKLKAALSGQWPLTFSG